MDYRFDKPSTRFTKVKARRAGVLYGNCLLNTSPKLDILACLGYIFATQESVAVKEIR